MMRHPRSPGHTLHATFRWRGTMEPMAIEASGEKKTILMDDSLIECNGAPLTLASIGSASAMAQSFAS